MAYPGIVDMAEDEEEIAFSEELIAFSDCIGNGNMFCFHRETGDVYYFDHDTGDMLTRSFSSVQEYLDALMIRCLSEVYEDDERGERLLIERFGEYVVKKWLY